MSSDIPPPQDRSEALHEYESWAELPVQILGAVWLVLLILEFTSGLSSALVVVSTIIWAVFIIDFAIRLKLAPRRRQFLKHNWLTALSLVVPALRVARLARALRFVRAARGIRLVRVVSSVNRGMRALRRTMGRRGLAYVILVTAIVTLVGAAGMYAFEEGAGAGGGITSYGEALWWTAMIMTTMGSQYWPTTLEGRILCVILSLYAFSVFGYVTASLASHFIDRDADRPDASVAGQEAILELRDEIVRLRAEVRALADRQRV
ncbi:MAG: ion transporter [Gemmatimonadaceae bacterium]